MDHVHKMKSGEFSDFMDFMLSETRDDSLSEVPCVNSKGIKT
jgi:hypothetical protein